MNPILDLFQETLKSGELTDEQLAQMMRDAQEMLPFLGNDLIPDLKRCLRARDVQVQLWALELLQQAPRKHQQDVQAMLQRQLGVEKRRTQRDNKQLIEVIQQYLDALAEQPVYIEYPDNPYLLNMFLQVRDMKINGGYARYQVEHEMLADARRWLASVDDEALPALQTVLRDHEPNIRIWAVRACENIPEKHQPAVIDLLFQQLHIEEEKQSSRTRQLTNAIKQLLAKLGDNRIVERELSKIGPENDYDTRKEAIRTLGQEVRQHRELLIELATNDDDIRVRLRAIEQLSTLTEDDALLDLYETFYGEDLVNIRTWSVRSILKSDVNDNRIYEIASKALDDDPKVMMEVIYALEKRNMLALMPTLMAKLSEMKTSYVWQVAKAVRSQILKYGNKPDDWQPLLDVLLNVDDSKSAIQGSRFAISALQGMSDLSAMPVFMNHMKHDANYDGDPNQRPSFTVLHVLRNMRRDIEWAEYEHALTPYITSDDLDEQFRVARIVIFAGEEDGYPILRQLRDGTTDADLIAFIDKHLSA